MRILTLVVAFVFAGCGQAAELVMRAPSASDATITETYQPAPIPSPSAIAHVWRVIGSAGVTSFDLRQLSADFTTTWETSTRPCDVRVRLVEGSTYVVTDLSPLIFDGGGIPRACSAAGVYVFRLTESGLLDVNGSLYERQYPSDPNG